MQLLRKIAFPISLIYAMVVHIRNMLFDFGVFGSIKFSTPTICVGNLSVGGTGKTPMVEYLIELLAPTYKIAVLSRGYKRKTKGFLMAKTGVTAYELGDEPYQLYRKYPKITVAVDANRRRGISTLEKTIQPDVIILDDAFQHRKVKPSLSILLTAHGSLYPDDWYLPTGNLRDAKKEANRAEVIAVTKCPKLPSEKEQKAIVTVLRPKSSQKLLFGTLQYADELIGTDENIPLASIEGEKVALVTGIAEPRPLAAFLKANGISFEHYKFADHHFFTEKDISQFRNHDLVITTSKDHTRLEGKVKGLYYIEVCHAFSEHDSMLLSRAIEENIKPDRPS